MEAFTELRALADALGAMSGRTSGIVSSSAERTAGARVVRLARRLGATAIPLLGRALRDAVPAVREAARTALAELAATDVRARVIAELHAVARGTASDETKVCALGLLAELGEHGAAQFRDPSAMRRRSATALAAQLETDGDIASAADLMLRQLPCDDIVHMVEAMLDTSPAAAHRLGGEIAVRLDAPLELRERVAAALVAHPLATPAPVTADDRLRRTTQVAVLVDAAARVVVVASRRGADRRWRRWAVLVGPTGRLDDCIHEDDAGDPAPVLAALCADGYRVASNEPGHARTLVAAAARRTKPLVSAYYVGRDLLDLRDAHLDVRMPRPAPDGSGRQEPAKPDPAALLGRAVELCAEGEPARARALLAGCDLANADAAAAVAACFVAEGRPADALDAQQRACAAEPSWPLHHWNLAAICHQLGDGGACYHALRRFLAASEATTALAGDPEQPARVADATRMAAELERRARLAGIQLAPPAIARRAPRRVRARPVSTKRRARRDDD